MLCISFQFKMKDLAHTFTSDCLSTAHPMHYRNIRNKKRIEQQQQRETKESL